MILAIFFLYRLKAITSSSNVVSRYGGKNLCSLIDIAALHSPAPSQHFGGLFVCFNATTGPGEGKTLLLAGDAEIV